MNENELNGTIDAEASGEVVQPESENGAAAQPENEGNNLPDVAAMSDDDFEEYLKSVQDGSGEVQTAPEADHNREDTEESEPTQKETQPEEKPEPFKTFATKEEWQHSIDDIIKKRLKGSREQREQLDGILMQAKMFYGEEDDAKAVRLLTDDLQTQNADRAGIDAETLKKQQQNEIDAKKYRASRREEADKEKRVESIKQRWRNEETELKKAVPDFDFKTAMQNKEFYDAVINGGSLGVAYISTIGKPTPPTTPQRRSIQQNGNTAAGQNVGAVSADPATMSDSDFLNYINKIRQG